ncbi:hypothetical protein [Roseitalea porphyridii]|uniref:Uncharacterized protein n=1 Tax=Roseitalea porphyridii TaxID=1852022 RepID=A0A4P6V2V3_9HYPH|nr:hypothetical protein [Roseitalea porphyridii]QBK30780.1 hypothetical protein E0E05_09350 [Roseitalea porphyridii]
MKPDDAREIRDSIGLALEILIAALDRIEGDPDLETADFPDDEPNGDDEPWLGQGGHHTDAGLQHDLEDDACDRGEPSLGWTNALDQREASTEAPGFHAQDAEIDVLTEPHDAEGQDHVGGGQGA